VLRYGDYLNEHRDKLSTSLIRQVETALSSDLVTVARGEKMRTTLWHRLRQFFATYDHLLSPTWGMVAFRIDVPFESKINGVQMANVFNCLHFTYAMGLVGLPAISVPCGRTRDGLPVGLQIAGRRLGEVSILEVAAAYERLRGPFGFPPDLSEQTPRPLSRFFQSHRG
jgi:amidase